MIIIETKLTVPISNVWEYWTNPKHIINWNFASEDWHCPKAHNDLIEGGNFSYRMEAIDGSMGFDLQGTYLEIINHEKLAYHFEDNRYVEVSFSVEGDQVKLVESFEPETINSEELQRAGWQAILDNFKKYTEAHH